MQLALIGLLYCASFFKRFSCLIAKEEIAVLLAISSFTRSNTDEDDLRLLTANRLIRNK